MHGPKNVKYLLDLICLGELIVNKMPYVQLQRGPLLLLNSWSVRGSADVVGILNQHGLAYVQVFGNLETLHDLYRRQAQHLSREECQLQFIHIHRQTYACASERAGLDQTVRDLPPS